MKKSIVLVLTMILGFTLTGCDLFTTTSATPVLNGNATEEIEVFTTWVDPGVDYTGTCTTTGTVDVNTVDTYTMTYDCDVSGTSTILTRTVNVVDLTDPIITLVGGAVDINVGDTYVEPGYEANDNYDGVLTSSVTVTGSINNMLQGSYYLDYEVADSSGNVGTATRLINVIGPATNNPPEIHLLGSATIYIDVNDPWVDPGYTADDIEDGPLTTSVVVTGVVNNGVAGTYTLSYSVTDSDLNTVTEYRTVIVEDVYVTNYEPVISLYAGVDLVVQVNSTYVEYGGYCYDYEDGDLSTSMTITGNVDTSAPGHNELTYSCIDIDLNETTETRHIEVVDDPQINNEPLITLYGQFTEYLDINDVWTEAGFAAYDYEDGDLTTSVVVTGTVDTSTLGIYQLTYEVLDSGSQTGYAFRTVVVETPLVGNAPDITLIDGEYFYLNQGDTWTDPGATASDLEDGDITLSIITTGTVDTNTLGTYTITYTVTDLDLNTASIVRYVIVEAVQYGSAPEIFLYGSNDLTIPQNSTYIEYNGYCYDIEDGYTYNNLVVTGTVDTTQIYDVELYYSCTDSHGNTEETMRIIHIVDVNVGWNNYPEISMYGVSAVILPLNSTWTDPGAVAFDYEEGDLTLSMVVGGTFVDTSTEGIYTITYDVVDSQGLAAGTYTRIVVVQDPLVEIPVIIMRGDATVTLNVNDEWGDPGAYAIDAIDGIMGQVSIGGDEVDLSTAGTYVITYDITDSSGNAAVQVTRTVIINP